MANKTGKDVAFKIDGAAATIVDITPHLNQATLQGLASILEDSALNDDERTYLAGLAGSKITLNGFVNTTTDAIFGPLIGNRTSNTKTFNYQAYTARHYTGECLIEDVQYSGAPDTVEMFSAAATVTGAVTRTSVAAS